MHRFLRSVGFSAFQRKRDIEQLLADLINQTDPSQVRKLQLDAQTNLCQVRSEAAPDMGIDIYGEMDDYNVFVPEYYVPYFLSHDISSDEECSIQRHTDKETYAGLLDEFRVGVSLIFYLENVMDYRERELAGENPEVSHVNLAGLASSGVILLPVEKTEQQAEMAQSAYKERTNLMEAARNGDEEAIETLTIEDIDMYTQISKRITKEDIYSIVDTSFMPCGIECDQYSVIGNILGADLKKNHITDEDVYDLKLECNDMIFHVGVNKLDLLGEPEVGMRFKGQIWMTGTAEFKS